MVGKKLPELTNVLVIGDGMDFFAQWFGQWKPGDFSVTLLVFIGVGFFIFRFWPWYTRIYLPKRMEMESEKFRLAASQEEKQNRLIQEMKDILIEVKVLTDSHVRAVNAVLDRLVPRVDVTVVDEPTKPSRKPRSKVTA